jgi:restriction system protein
LAKREEPGVLDLLVDLPWWVSICVAGIAFLLIRFGLPMIGSDGMYGGVFAAQAPALSWFAAIFLLPAPVSALRSWQKRRLLDTQDGIESIRRLSWREFEMLLGEAFRRQGYGVVENSSAGPDGGIDLVVTKDGRTVLVQCKHWRERKVGVKIVREMLGLVTAHSTGGAIVVTSGDFTQEAKSFASGQPIRLIPGDELVTIIRSVQNPAAATSALEQTPAAAAPAAPRTCPKCGARMVIRVARRGDNAGGTFWGCTSYPNCRHTEPSGG